MRVVGVVRVVGLVRVEGVVRGCEGCRAGEG